MLQNKVLTLAFIQRAGHILLGYKKRGFGAGRWNGFGGKVEPGETIAEAAKRELLEESGVRAENLQEIGVLMFEFIGDEKLLEVHVFNTEQFSGTIAESDEMRPQWYDLDAIPFSQMWPDDHLWFPLLLGGKKFYGYFRFDGMDTIVSHHLTEVKNIGDIVIPKAPLANCGGEVP